MEKPASTQHGNILVVDDESGVRIFLKKALTQMGHTVDTIADAQTAMEKLDSGTTYDIILTDVRMAGISGIELYFHIIEKTPAMKNRIVFITGDIMGPDIKNFFTQNGLTYLTKPFSIETMREKINRILMTGQPNNNNLDGSGR
jgi:two-component system NtrC family sensor kinase